MLYVTEHRARIGVAKRNILVRRPDSATRVPVEALEAIVMFGGQITSDALALCAERGIGVTALRRSGKVRFRVSGRTGGNVLLRVAQYRSADDPVATATISRSVVGGKLANYVRLLRRWSWDASGPNRVHLQAQIEVVSERIRSLPGVEDGDRIRGIEGDATRRYFKGLGAHVNQHSAFGTFEVRTRRPPRDPMNALMSFLYALVLSEVVGALEAVGLDPQVGFLHGLRPGRPSLGLDLLEEFRPSIADRLAVRLVCRRELGPEHFVRTGAGACYLNDDGRGLVLKAYEQAKTAEELHPLLDRVVPVWSLPGIQSTLMARHLRGDLPAYPPFVATS